MAKEKDYCVRISNIKHTEKANLIRITFGPKAPAYLRRKDRNHYCSVRKSSGEQLILDIWCEPMPRGQGRVKIDSRTLTASLARPIDMDNLKPFVGEYDKMTTVLYSDCNNVDRAMRGEACLVATYIISMADRMNFTNIYAAQSRSRVEEACELKELSPDDKIREEYKNRTFKPVATICKPLTKAGDDIIMSVNDIIREQIDECSKRIRELQRNITELEYRKRTLEAASRALIKEG